MTTFKKTASTKKSKTAPVAPVAVQELPVAVEPVKKASRSKKPAAKLTVVATQSAEAAASNVAVEEASTEPKLERLIYQIYFDDRQLDGLDPAFQPYDNSAARDLLREFTVFEKIAADASKQAKLWGALSWRFEEKTGLKGTDLERMLDQQPGFDLYYCNPFPENEALFANGWQQGSISHPALIEICEALFKVAGLDARDLSSVQPSASFSACNYFVGTEKFWGAYLPWVRNILDKARAELPESLLKVMDSSLSDPRLQHVGSSYWPFIVERLLPLFLRAHGAGLKICKLRLEVPESKLNVHLQRLHEMKDMACRTQSRWLYTCWLSYRNLYMMQTQGREWAKRNLPALTHGEADFW